MMVKESRKSRAAKVRVYYHSTGSGAPQGRLHIPPAFVTRLGLWAGDGITIEEAPTTVKGCRRFLIKPALPGHGYRLRMASIKREQDILTSFKPSVMGGLCNTVGAVTTTAPALKRHLEILIPEEAYVDSGIGDVGGEGALSRLRTSRSDEQFRKAMAGRSYKSMPAGVVFAQDRLWQAQLDARYEAKMAGSAAMAQAAARAVNEQRMARVGGQSSLMNF